MLIMKNNKILHSSFFSAQSICTYIYTYKHNMTQDSVLTSLKIIK